MGNFKIEINAVGGHGLDRSKKDGEVVDFNIDGEYSPEAIATRLIRELKRFGVDVQSATITHWPGTAQEVQDDLMIGVRKGNF